jgi:DHA1 family bicyclomycin/chloramphenicol resistance-like MFS transporter
VNTGAAPSHAALLAILVAQAAFGLLVMTLSLPSMPDWRATFPGDPAQVQLTFSGYVLAFGSLQLVYGPLSDRLGRLRVLLAGLALAAVGSVVAALADTLSVLVAGRVLQGAGAAAGMVVGRASVQDLFEGPQKTRAMAYVGMAMGLCPPLGTIVGGQLHAAFGWRANFALSAALAAALFALAWRTLPRDRDRDRDRPAPGTHWLRQLAAGYARLAREPAFLLNVAVLAFTVGAFYAFLGGAPLVLDRYGVTPERIGWYVMVAPLSYIAGNWLTSQLAHATGPRVLMTLGQAASLAGVGTVAALGAAGLGSPLAFALPLMLLGIGHGLLVPTCLVGTVSLVPALAGSAAAVAGVSQQLMGAFAGYAVGWVPHEGQVNLGLQMLAFTGCAIVAQAVLFARAPRARRG